jgi:hypothetical protein
MTKGGCSYAQAVKINKDKDSKGNNNNDKNDIKNANNNKTNMVKLNKITKPKQKPVIQDAGLNMEVCETINENKSKDEENKAETVVPILNKNLNDKIESLESAIVAIQSTIETFVKAVMPLLDLLSHWASGSSGPAISTFLNLLKNFIPSPQPPAAQSSSSD